MALSRLDSQPSILVLDEENECPKCKEFQRQIKDLRERLDAADEPLKHYENLKSQKNWLIKYVTSLTPYKLEENFLLPLVRNPMIRMSFRRFRGAVFALIAATRIQAKSKQQFA